MNTATTDAQLVSSYLAGDRSALAAIYDRYAPGLYDTARAMLSNTHDASDMVQDVFCLAAERLGQLRDPDRLKPWLYAVLRNEVYKRTKRRRRATPTDFQSENTPDVPASYDPQAPGESVAYEELASLVRAASAGLDERDRLVLELSLRQGLSGADLAAALGVTSDQSYSLVHRMRDRVEKSLGALTLARAGRRDCPDLDLLLSGWNGEFTVLVRKRVNRHLENCSTCDENRRKLAPLALFGAAPAFALPSGLRDRVLASAARLPTSGSTATTARTTWRPDGFPVSRRGLSLWFAGGAATLLVVGGVVTGLVASGGGLDEDRSPSATTAPLVSETAPIDSTTSPLDSLATLTTIESPPVQPPSSVGAPAAVTSTPTIVTAPEAPSTTVVREITTTTKPPVVAIRALVVSSTTLDFGSAGTTVTLTISNPNAISVALDVGSPSALFGVSGAPNQLGGGKSATLTISFDRAAAESYSQTTTFPEGRFSKSLIIDSSSPSTSSSSGATNSVTLTGAVTRAPMVGKVAASFSATGCTSLRVQATVSDESALKGVTATVNIGGATRTVSLTLVSGNTYAGTVSGLPAGAATTTIIVAASDSIGRSGTATTSTTQPTSC
jgi:RNA polymerase sigma factor (sigma-70 family)